MPTEFDEDISDFLSLSDTADGEIPPITTYNESISDILDFTEEVRLLSIFNQNLNELLGLQQNITLARIFNRSILDNIVLTQKVDKLYQVVSTLALNQNISIEKIKRVLDTLNLSQNISTGRGRENNDALNFIEDVCANVVYFRQIISELGLSSEINELVNDQVYQPPSPLTPTTPTLRPRNRVKNLYHSLKIKQHIQYIYNNLARWYKADDIDCYNEPVSHLIDHSGQDNDYYWTSNFPTTQLTEGKKTIVFSSTVGSFMQIPIANNIFTLDLELYGMKATTTDILTSNVPSTNWGIIWDGTTFKDSNGFTTIGNVRRLTLRQVNNLLTVNNSIITNFTPADWIEIQNCGIRDLKYHDTVFYPELILAQDSTAKYYRLNDNVIEDQSGNLATITGTPTLEAGRMLTNVRGNDSVLISPSNYVTLNSNTARTSTVWTLEFWIKWTTSNVGLIIGPDVAEAFVIGTHLNGTIQTWQQGHAVINSSGITPIAGDLYHIVWSRSNNSYRLVINGVQVSVVSYVATTPYTGPIVLGNTNPTSDTFRISELALHSSFVSNTILQSHYSVGSL